MIPTSGNGSTRPSIIWTKHIKGLDPDELHSLVKLPTAGEFLLLRETIEHMFEVAMLSIEQTPPLILMWLKMKESSR